MKETRAKYVPDEDEDEEELYGFNGYGDEEMSSVSFGALNRAQRELAEEQQSGSEDEMLDSDSDGPPEEETSGPHKRRSKHAPAEASSKRPVSWIRDVPGLDKKKTDTLYRDIRFDAAYGKADLARTRKDYAFLNEYREKEIEEMTKLAEKTKDLDERAKLRTAIQAQQSRLKTMKDRDFEHEVLSKHKKENRNSNYFLKRSDKRNLVLKEKFKTMKKKDVDRVIERRRKKNASKERKQMPLERRR
jgi:ribosomal RNA-processing protein 36